jgi:hypothetical protein
MYSIASSSVCSIPASITVELRRSDSPPAMLRWPFSSGDTTSRFALICYFEFTQPHVPIRDEYSNWRLICEFLGRWCHLWLSQMVWLGHALVAGDLATDPTTQSLWVELDRVQKVFSF